MVLHAVESLCLSKKQAKEITGGLSVPSKMPGKAYSIPAKRCITGAKMRDVPGSICSGCYALKGRYGFQNVQDAQERRFQSLNDPQWIDAMVVLVRDESWFRWHDSGDLQSLAHFERIIEVCKRTPNTRHWLPTREYGIVRQYVEAGGIIPDNLTIRFSSLMFDGAAPEAAAKRLGVQVSGASKAAFTCPAYGQGNVCGECRACWNRDVFNVTYRKH